jgi:hypothetical protein
VVFSIPGNWVSVKKLKEFLSVRSNHIPIEGIQVFPDVHFRKPLQDNVILKKNDTIYWRYVGETLQDFEAKLGRYQRLLIKNVRMADRDLNTTSFLLRKLHFHPESAPFPNLLADPQLPDNLVTINEAQISAHYRSKFLDLEHLEDNLKNELSLVINDLKLIKQNLQDQNFSEESMKIYLEENNVSHPLPLDRLRSTHVADDHTFSSMAWEFVFESQSIETHRLLGLYNQLHIQKCFIEDQIRQFETLKKIWFYRECIRSFHKELDRITFFKDDNVDFVQRPFVEYNEYIKNIEVDIQPGTICVDFCPCPPLGRRIPVQTEERFGQITIERTYNLRVVLTFIFRHYEFILPAVIRASPVLNAVIAGESILFKSERFMGTKERIYFYVDDEYKPVMKWKGNTDVSTDVAAIDAELADWSKLYQKQSEEEDFVQLQERFLFDITSK